MNALPEPADPNAAYFFDLQGLLYPFWTTQRPWAARKLIELMRRIMLERRPAFACFAGDLPFPTFRHEIAAKHFSAERLYKADRKALDPALKASLLEQLRIAEELLQDVFGIHTLKHRGAEADDIIATLVAQALARGMRAVVVAHDRDLMQLVDEPRVLLWDGRSKVTGRSGVIAALGVRPEQVADYFAIVGGKNNIPGVRGLGEKAAVEILRTFPSLEAAISLVERQPPGTGAVPGLGRVAHEKLAAGAFDGRASLKLARLDRALPLSVGLDELRVPPFVDWQ